MSYLEKHKSCGIKIGDIVRVVRKAEDYEDGWENTWVYFMDDFVGETFLVESDQFNNGFSLVMDGCFDFPYFVLEKVGEENIIQNISSSCPNCNGELKDHYSEWAGKDIKKCKSCGWC
jgi:hypothetical protein